MEIVHKPKSSEFVQMTKCGVRLERIQNEENHITQDLFAEQASDVKAPCDNCWDTYKYICQF